MPLFRPRNPEDAPASGDPAQNLAENARLRTHTLTEELLDWLIAALEAVIQTPEVRSLAEKRVRSGLHDALKLADHLYPHTQEVKNRAHQVREEQGVVLGLERAFQDEGEGG